MGTNPMEYIWPGMIAAQAISAAARLGEPCLREHRPSLGSKASLPFLTQLPKKTSKLARVNRSAPRPEVSGSSVSGRA